MAKTIGGGPPDVVDVYVGGRVRALRKLQGMSQTALADEIGLTFQQIQKYERGFNRISASVLYRIAGALGVVPAEFFAGLPDPRDHHSHVTLALKTIERSDPMLGVSSGAAMAEAFPKLKSKYRRLLAELARKLVAEGGAE